MDLAPSIFNALPEVSETSVQSLLVSVAESPTCNFHPIFDFVF
jgi:hypothetical protein